MVNPSIVRMADVASRQVSWFWRHWIALGALNVMDGNPGEAKTTLALDLAARASRDGKMPDGSQGATGGVLFCTAEDSLEYTIRPRLEAAGADLKKIRAITVLHEDEGERMPELPTDLGLLRDAIKDEPTVLVVIDPLMAYLAADVNAHRDHHVRRALAPLAAIADETGAAILVIRHLNKAPGGDPIYRGGGSIGIIGAARAGMLVARDPDDESIRVLAPTKSNLGPAAPAMRFGLEPVGHSVRINWLGRSEHSATSLLSSGELGPVAEAKRFLVQVLAGGEVPSKEVERQASEASISPKTLRVAKDRLGIKPRRSGFGSAGVWVWSLPIRSSLLPIEGNNGQVRASMEDIDAKAPIDDPEKGWTSMAVLSDDDFRELAAR